MRRCCVLLYVCLPVFFPGRLCPAQNEPGSAFSSTPEAGSPGAGAAEGSSAPPKGELGDEYVDASFGFGVRPLAGASLDRRKRTVEGQLQLAQFVRLDVGWSMAVRLWSTDRPIDERAVKENLQARLGCQYPDLQITSTQALQVAARDAVRLTAGFSAEGRNWLRQQAVIRLWPKQQLVILLTSPADDRDLAVQAFDRILESFQVHRTEIQQRQIDAALGRGVALLQSVAAGERKLAAEVNEPTFLRLSREGRAIGFVEIGQRAAKLNGREGVQVFQQAWLFNPDQSVQYVQEQKFLASDLSYDEWRNLSELKPASRTDPEQRLVVSVEAGIRRGDQLVVEYNTHLGVSERHDKVIEVEPSYAAAAWPLLMPRLVDLREPGLFAFSMYDSERRGMVLRAIRVVGPLQVTVAGRRVSGFKIEDSEGLLPPVSEMIVDEAGRLIRLSSGPVEMVVAAREEIEQEFAGKVKAVQEQFRKNAGLGEPRGGPGAPAGKEAPRPGPDSPRRPGGRAGSRGPAR